MRGEINRLIGKYMVKTAESEIISGLFAKYGIKKADVENYIFNEREKRYFIPLSDSPQYLFPPGLNNNEYIKIIDRMYFGELAELFEFSQKNDMIFKLTNRLIREVDRCKETLIRKLSSADDEEKSEICTELFVKAIETDLKKIFETCMYKDDDEWQQTGSLIYKFLKNNCFFTPEVIENSVRSEYVSIKTSYPIGTKDMVQNGKIELFYSLPYCVAYYDSNDEEMRIRCIEGVCRYYKHEE